MHHSSGRPKYCAKCLSVLGDKVVKDILGQEFCNKFCRSEWWAEDRKEAMQVYNWWIGERDDA